MMEALAYFDIEHAHRWIEAGGYLLLFLLLFACGLGFPMPEEIPLLLAGFAISQGQMNLAIGGTVAWCGIIGGDICLYHLGSKYGLQITRVSFIGRYLTRTRIERAEHLFARYGIWVVAIGRLFTGVRAAMVVAAGAIRFNFAKFVIVDGLAALVSGGLFIAIGYWGGRTLGDADETMRRVAPYHEALIIGIAIAVLLVIAYLWWRHKRHKSIGDLVAERAEQAIDVER
jgi:membrane protein DedA with SNARE-associated domain